MVRKLIATSRLRHERTFPRRQYTIPSAHREVKVKKNILSPRFAAPAWCVAPCRYLKVPHALSHWRAHALFDI